MGKHLVGYQSSGKVTKVFNRLMTDFGFSNLLIQRLHKNKQLVICNQNYLMIRLLSVISRPIQSLNILSLKRCVVVTFFIGTRKFVGILQQKAQSKPVAGPQAVGQASQQIQNILQAPPNAVDCIQNSNRNNLLTKVIICSFVLLSRLLINEPFVDSRADKFTKPFATFFLSLARPLEKFLQV